MWTMKRDGSSKSLRKQMALVVAGGVSASIIASLAFFYFESSQVAGQLEERSLFRQARLLLKDFAVAENGRVEIKISPQSEKAYKDRTGTFAYTIFDSEGRPVAVSPNIDAPLPFFHEVPNSQAPVAHRFIAVPTPSGHVLVLSRRDSGASAVARGFILSHLIRLFFVWLVLILLAIPLI